MGGRFTQHNTRAQIHDFLNVFAPPRDLQPPYHIAPTTSVDVIRMGGHDRELVSMRWGLVPLLWKKPLRELPATSNARAETVADKPMFRSASKDRRCIIPASGFHEWTGGKGARQSHRFTAADDAPVLASAGLWDCWHDHASSDQVLPCTINVSGASVWMTPYHDRMPVLLSKENFDGWLYGSLGPEVRKPAPEAVLREWPVSTRLNRTGYGDHGPTMVEAEFPGSGKLPRAGLTLGELQVIGPATFGRHPEADPSGTKNCERSFRHNHLFFAARMDGRIDDHP